MPEIGKNLSHYTIVEKLGAGGMGEVYKARDTRLDRTVALKVLKAAAAPSADLRQRFEREARAIAALNHPHICTLFDVGRDGDTDFFVMEYCEGETLAQRLIKGPLPLDQVLRYGTEIADALDKAHRAGIVHRDLKPGNIMMTKGGVKLLDFGLARLRQAGAAGGELLTQATATEPLTAAGTILGTLHYMAPEQLEGKDADARADIFALGTVLYEMVTGRKAFEGASAASVISAVMSGAPKAIASVQPLTPPALEQVVASCLAKDPDERWQSAADVARQLRWIAEKPAAAESQPVATQTRRHTGVFLWTAAAAIFIFLAGAFLSYWLLKSPSVSKEPIVSYLLAPADSVSCFQDGFAVSPDGRRIAFSSLSLKGERLIWVRDLARPDSVPLDGTKGAAWPFWSPDGKNIGFYADGWLKYISVDSGHVQQLCRGSLRRDYSTWGSAGTILFGGFWSGLFRVSETGGDPINIPAPASLSPSFLDDGTTFVFGKTLNAKPLAFSSSLRQPDVHKMIKGFADVGGIQWAGNDWFMVYRHTERNLVAQRVDLKKGEAIGSPKAVAERVPAPSGYPAFSVSPAGLVALLVNPPEARNDNPRRLIWVDRHGKELGQLGDIRGYWYARISHDGRHVAISPDDDIWISDAVTGLPVRLTREMDAAIQGEVDFPVWSPRDDHILGSVSTLIDATILRSYDVSGGQFADILPGDEMRFATDWSRDGRYILSTRFQQADADLAYYDFNDEQVKPFLATAAYEDFGVLSPDGHWIAYSSNATGTLEVYVRPFPAVGPEKRVSSSGGMHPRWRAIDGKELFFLTPDRKVMAAEVKLQPSLEVGAPVELFRREMADTVHGMISPYDVTPDGQRFLVIVPVQSTPLPLTLIHNWKAFIER